MENLPLNLKYRPNTLYGMYGTGNYLSICENFFEREDRPRIYLFYGPPGCGKTTLARVFARELKGDAKEYNISNTTGVDTARAILDKLHYKSLKGPRVLIFNECHRASKNFQDAMLEAFEEPPPDTYFILVTTEPDKLLSTVLSRCTKIELRPLSRNEIIQLLKDVYVQEELEPDMEIIKKIAKISEGVPRDALVLLNKIIDMNREDEDYEKFLDGLKSFETTTIELCRALKDRLSWDKVAKIIDNLNEDPETVRYAILGFFTKSLLRSGKPADWYVLDVFSSTFIYNKKAGLVKACFEIINSEN